MTSNDIVRVRGRGPADEPTYFYLWYYGVVEYNAEKNHEPRKEFFVVQKSHYSIKDMTDKPVIELLDFGNMALYQAVDIQDQ